MSKILYCCLLLYLLFVSASASPIKNKKFSRNRRSIDLISSLEHITDTRLPRDVAPTGYRLELQPFLEEGEFQGHVTINITCQEDTDKITIHAHQELEIIDGDVSVIFIPPQPLTSTTTTTTTTTEPPPVAPVPVGAARLLPVSSSFVPDNACLSATSCNSNTGHTNSLQQPNGKHTKGSQDEDVPEAEALASPDSSKKVETHPPTLPVQSSVPVAKEETKVLTIPPHVVPLTISKTERQANKQWYIIHLADRLKRGEEYQLDIKFSGALLADSRDGFFIDTYVDKESQERRHFVATQLRPNHARRVFPCFDEPAFKVPLEVSIAHTSNLTALSNMPIRNTEQGEPGWVWDHFQRTPPMSTHTFAIIISDLKSATPKTAHEDKETYITNEDDYNQPTHPNIRRKGKPPPVVVAEKVTVWGRKDLLPTLQNAADNAPKAIAELENYLGLSLPVPKVDLVALPGYTAIPDSNWGLIVFRESDLTTDEFLLKHITREMVYQWIGNLITPHWWSEVHINKALANFIAYIISLKIDSGAVPNSGLWTKNYPLYYEYGRNQPYKQIPSQKPPNTVTKSELVLRMLNYTLSGATFQKGIQQLIGERQFKTFTQDDLWSALTEQAGIDDTLPEPSTVNQIAESWIKKERLPVVKITRDYEKNSAEVEQSVFIREIPEEGQKAAEENFTWWIPLVMVPQNNLDFVHLKPSIWMKEEKRIILNHLPPSTYFIIVNPEEIGPFLVNYDRKNWYMISEYLEKYGINEQIPPATRAKLIHDSLNLAYAGSLRFDSALNVTKFLINEKDPIVWQAAFNMFDHIQRQIEGSETAVRFQEYIKAIVVKPYTQLEKIESKLTKSQERMYKSAKSALCNAGYQPCIDEARGQWKKWMQSEELDAGIPIHQSHFCWVFKWGTREEWEFGLERYFNFPVNAKQSDKYYLLKTLISCTTDSWNVERLLNLTMLDANSNITESNTRFILSVLSNEVGYTALFNLLADNWDAIKNKYDKKESGLWDNIVSAATRNFKDKEGVDMVSELYAERSGEFGSADQVIEQSLKHIKQESKWNEDNIGIIDQWLENYLSSHGVSSNNNNNNNTNNDKKG